MDVNFKTTIQAEYNDLINGKNEIFKYIDYKTGFKILSNETLAFKNPLSMNYPYDCSLKLLDISKPSENYLKDLLKKKYAYLNREERRKRIAYGVKNFTSKLPGILQNSIETDLKKRGITCFSEINDNLLMWSHYGKSHTGICIGFNVEKLYKSIKNIHPLDKMLIKVKYESVFQTMDYFKFETESLVNWVRTKSIDWAYEKEVRIILHNLIFDSNELYILPIDKNCVKNVYLGSRILPENESYIRELVAGQYPEVIIKKLKLHTNKFELIFE